MVSQCGELADKTVDRADMLDRFFEGAVFKILEATPDKAEDMLNILVKVGPVYGRGNLLDFKTGVEAELLPPWRRANGLNNRVTRL